MFTDSLPQKQILSFFPSVHGVGMAYFTYNKQHIFSTMMSSRKRDVQKYSIRCLEHISSLVPSVIVIEEFRKSKGSIKKGGTKEILEAIYRFAIKHHIEIKCYTRNDIREVFSSHNAMNKYEIAQLLCDWIPSLQKYNFVKRTDTKPEPYASAIFDAVSLCGVFLDKENPSGK